MLVRATPRVLQSSLTQGMCFSVWTLCAPLCWWQCMCEALLPLHPSLPFVLLLPSWAWLAVRKGSLGQCSLHFGCGVDRAILLTPMQLKSMQEKKCSQVGEEIVVYGSLLCPSPHLVSSSNKSLHRSNASPVSHNCLYSSIIVFLVWSVLKYLSNVGKWVGWERRILLSTLFGEKLCW